MGISRLTCTFSFIVRLILTVILPVFFLLSSCDSEDSTPKDLNENKDLICSSITNDSNLSLDGLGLGEEFCSTELGKNYIDLTQLTEDSNITSKDGEKIDDNIYSFWTRTEFYVENTKPEASQQISNILENLVSSTSSNVQYHINMVNEKSTNEESKITTASFDIVSSAVENGLANISNRWNLYEKNVENTIIISVQTEGSTLESTSIVESGKIFMVIIPDTNGFYLDVLTQFNLHAKGINAATKKTIITMLNQALYNIKQTLS